MVFIHQKFSENILLWNMKLKMNVIPKTRDLKKIIVL